MKNLAIKIKFFFLCQVLNLFISVVKLGFFSLFLEPPVVVHGTAGFGTFFPPLTRYIGHLSQSFGAHTLFNHKTLDSEMIKLTYKRRDGMSGCARLRNLNELCHQAILGNSNVGENL